MARTALAMMLSFVLLIFVTPAALAKADSKQTSKPNVKKAAVAKTPAVKRPAVSGKTASRPATITR